MKNFETNADTIAIVSGIVLTIIVIASYIFSVSAIAGSFDRAINPETIDVPLESFNIAGAEKLNVRGLSAGR